MKKLLLLGLLSVAAQAQGWESAWIRAQETHLWSDPAWLKLGHYDKSSFGGYKSYVDGPKFFLSLKGRGDPKAEMEATLQAFYSAPQLAKDEMHPRCRFPARFIWLQKKLGLQESEMPKADCSRFTTFRERLATRSATLVFSSFYINNPSSAFGHLLLRLNRGDLAKGDERFQLLDYGINYAAEVDTDNGLSYAFQGLFGYFKGTYLSIPYYYKVREYNDYEARDLWEYDLELNEEQIRLLVAHVWELGPSYTDYYYLDENCATHIVTLLDAVVPEKHLTEQLPSWIVMPTDALKVIAQTPGLIRAVQYRPSIRTQFQARLRLLSDQERSLLRDLRSEQDLAILPPSLSASSRARILDAAVDDLDFRFSKEFLVEKSGPQAWKQTMLVARAQTGVTGEAPDYAKEEYSRPDQGHASRRVSLSGGFSQEYGAFGDLDIRAGLQDLLDSSYGYFSQAEVEFLSFKMRYSGHDRAAMFADRRGFRVQDAAIMRVRSLVEMNAFQKKPSWALHVGGTRFRDKNCNDCFGGIVEGGIGTTFLLTEGTPLLAFMLLEVEVAAAHFMDSWGRVGGGPRVGLKYSWNDDLNFLVESSYRRYAVQMYPDRAMFKGAVQWSVLRNAALNLNVERWSRGWDYQLGGHVYF